MKTLVLFSRNDLVNLYGGLSQHLPGEIRVIHLAYSSSEESILQESYGITGIINFKDEINRLFQSEKPDPELIKEIDRLIIETTGNRFCLNSCIQSDRTFEYLPYSQILLLVQVYYRFWNEFMSRHKFDVLMHEPVALFFLQIASVICKRNNAQYLTQIQVFGKNKYDWIFVFADNGFAVEMPGRLSENKILNDKSRKNAEEFLAGFRQNFDLIIPQIASNVQSPKKWGWWDLTIKMVKTILKYYLGKAGSKKRHYSPQEHVEQYLNISRARLSDRLKNQWDEYFQLKYDLFDPAREFYYYPMHMEPEAVVLYWGDGIYKNQIKLIENIAGQLPPDCFLYVKVHPIVKEDRYYLDYKRIKAIPNVRLLGPDVPGKMITAACKGLMTINGTSGFEAVLLNKPVYVFGNSFYDLSDRVFKIMNIRELRAAVYQNHNKEFRDDESLIRFVNSFLEISHPGFTAYYSNYKEVLNIDHRKNVEEVANGIDKFLFNK